MATFTVGVDWTMPHRCDAGLLPHITRVDNPYATPEAPTDVAPDPPGSRALRTPPCDAVREVAEEGRFKNLKKGVRSNNYPHSS